ncbi:MAG: PIN domain-containing protein [Methylococcales bacterium]|nr:PIN domain-containing protein [Methylococcales bacterium]
MTRKRLLDTNLIIAAFDNKDPEAIAQLTSLLNDGNTAFAISPLIRYEVLRGVSFADNERYEHLKTILNVFEEFEISRDIATLSSHLFRFSQSKKEDGKNALVNKRSFDVFHLATAKCNELELCSNDGDLGKLENLYQEWLSSNQNDTLDY